MITLWVTSSHHRHGTSCIEVWTLFLQNPTVKNVAGRLFTKARRPAGEWVIVDRSDGLEKTDFSVEEHGSDMEEGWEN